MALAVSPALWSAIDARHQKEKDATWRACAHTTTCVLGVAACAGEPWAFQPRLLWEDWPHQHHGTRLILLYAVFCGFSLGSLPEVKRSQEAKTMAAHHALTLALVVASFSYGFMRIGSLLMVFNDFTDLWFEAAKLTRYRDLHRRSDLLLRTCVVVWLVLRQGIAGILIHSTYHHGHDVLGERLCVWQAFIFLLCFLWVMHAYWWIFLARKCLR